MAKKRVKFDDAAIAKTAEDWRNGLISEMTFDRRIAKAQCRIGDPFDFLWENIERRVDDTREVLQASVKEMFDIYLMPLIEKYVDTVAYKMQQGIAQGVSYMLEDYEKSDGHTEEAERIAEIENEITDSIDQSVAESPAKIRWLFKNIMKRIEKEGW